MGVSIVKPVVGNESKQEQTITDLQMAVAALAAQVTAESTAAAATAETNATGTNTTGGNA